MEGHTRPYMPSEFRPGIALHEPDVTEVQVDYVPIRERPEADRPREKLLSRGPATLSDAELIGLVFGSGTRVGGRSVSAVELGPGQVLRRSGPRFNTIFASRDLNAITNINITHQLADPIHAFLL